MTPAKSRNSTVLRQKLANQTVETGEPAVVHSGQFLWLCGCSGSIVPNAHESLMGQPELLLRMDELVGHGQSPRTLGWVELLLIKTLGGVLV